MQLVNAKLRAGEGRFVLSNLEVRYLLDTINSSLGDSSSMIAQRAKFP